MLIIFTGEKDEKLTSKQNLFVEKKKKTKKRGEKKNHLNVEELASCFVFCT